MNLKTGFLFFLSIHVQFAFSQNGVVDNGLLYSHEEIPKVFINIGSQALAEQFNPSQTGDLDIFEVDQNTETENQANQTALIGVDKEDNNVSRATPLIYPNPTRNSVTIVLIDPNSTIEVLTTEGRVLRSKQGNNLREIIDLGAFSNGIYLIRITSNQNTYVQKVTKQ